MAGVILQQEPRDDQTLYALTALTIGTIANTPVDIERFDSTGWWPRQDQVIFAEQSRASAREVIDMFRRAFELLRDEEPIPAPESLEES